MEKTPIIMTIIILLIGSIAYFALDLENKTDNLMDQKNSVSLKTKDLSAKDMDSKTKQSSIQSSIKDNGIFQGLRLKVAFTPEGTIKIFSLAKNNELSKFKASLGDNLPESNSMVIGNDEAMMMKSENLFNQPGDQIIGFFGINITIGGVLEKTETVMDDMHFMSHENFAALEGEEGKIFIKINDEGMPKLFYSYYPESEQKLSFILKEGDANSYITHDLAGQIYYPILIGSKEAEIMKSEKLFSKPGDIIKGFFGRNVIIVGIISDTGTSLDMMHLIPLDNSMLS